MYPAGWGRWENSPPTLGSACGVVGRTHLAGLKEARDVHRWSFLKEDAGGRFDSLN